MAGRITVNKVLVIRFSSLGDIVLTSLLIRCLKKQKKSQIHFLTKKAFVPIVSSNPYIDKVWTLEPGLNTILAQLKEERFDLIIDLHHNIRSRQVRLNLWKVPVVTYDKANLAKWFAVYFKLFRFPKDHIALRYLNTITKFDVSDDGDGLDFFIPPSDKIDLFDRFKIPGPFIALVIGAAHFTKRVPLEKLKELLSSLSPGHQIVLIGGREEQKISSQLAGQNIFDACGLLSITQSASVLEQARLVIAPDTGMMHIAAALKKPIKSIWGSTLPEFGFWPFYGFNHPDQNQSFEIEGLPCRPCSRFGRTVCPKGHFKCMMDQDMAQIAQSVND